MTHDPQQQASPPPAPIQTDTLEPGCLRLISRLAELDWATDFYLAGSAALALYLGHRRIRNLDLMGYRRLRSPERRDILQDLLALDPEVRVETARDGYLYVRFSDFDGAGVRFFYYPYPLVGAEEEIENLAVASALDLALMKLGAVISRGHRRDFLDLYLLHRVLPLGEMLDRSPEKYGHVRDFQVQALKGLTDISSAKEEPMPKLEIAVSWQEVESWILGEVRDQARGRVGLG